MLQKIIKVGNSSAITLPHKILKEEGLLPGDMFDVQVTKEPFRVILEPHKKLLHKKAAITPEFVRSVDEFIQAYRPALEELAQK